MAGDSRERCPPGDHARALGAAARVLSDVRAPTLAVRAGADRLTPGAALALQRSAGNRAVGAFVASRAAVARASDAPSPAPPPWLEGVAATHVEGNIWEVEFSVGGSHYVGPYDELKAFVKRKGLVADAHHIVGGEHLKDLGSAFSYENAPAVAIDPGLHERVITPRIGYEQAIEGGRRGGRVALNSREVAAMYRAAYTEQAEFRELSRIAGNITRLVGIVGVASELYAPIAAAQQIDEAAAEMGRTIGVPLGQQRARLEHPELVPIGNEIRGQSFMFDPQQHGPATLYRIVGDPLEAADLHVRPGGLVKVAELWYQGDKRWESEHLEAVSPIGFIEWFNGQREVWGRVEWYPESGHYVLNVD